MDKNDKFLCETHRCTITVSGCLLRQERNSEKKQPPAWMFNKIPGDPRCANCEQGKQVKKGNYKPRKEDFMETKTVAAELDNLEAAAKKRGRSPKVEPAPMETKTCRICKGEFPADRKHFSPAPSNQDKLDNRCKDCARTAKAANRNPPENPRKKPLEPVTPRKVLQVDFTDHPHLYDWLVKTARKEFRTPGLQVLATIALDATDVCKEA